MPLRKPVNRPGRAAGSRMRAGQAIATEAVHLTDLYQLAVNAANGGHAIEVHGEERADGDHNDL